ncbi:MAG: hypothetical protein RR614_05795 [Eubacterium sp.]
MIVPDRFIPLFEKNGFIIELDMYMVEKVCKMDIQRVSGRTDFRLINQDSACIIVGMLLQSLGF